MTSENENIASLITLFVRMQVMYTMLIHVIWLAAALDAQFDICIWMLYDTNIGIGYPNNGVQFTKCL